MRYGVVTFWTSELSEVAHLTQPVLLEYCGRYGHAPHLTGPAANDTGRHPVWARLALARDLLRHYEALAVFDVDILITDLSQRLNDLCGFRACPDVNLVCGSDRYGVNAGVLFLRNTPWCHEFLARWWAAGDHFARHPSPEQSALASLLCCEPPAHWAVRRQAVFNSYHHRLYGMTHPEGEWAPGHFAMHLPGLSADQRIQVLTEYLPMVRR